MRARQAPTRQRRAGQPQAGGVRGTIGVHAKRGRWLVNGSADGLVEITIDPPCHTARRPVTLFRRMEVNALTVSLVDPDGFVAAVSRWLPKQDGRP